MARRELRGTDNQPPLVEQQSDGEMMPLLMIESLFVGNLLLLLSNHHAQHTIVSDGYISKNVARFFVFSLKMIGMTSFKTRWKD